MAVTCKKCGRQLTPQQAGGPCPQCGSMDRDLTVQDFAVIRDKAAAAKELAKRHYEIEPGVTRVIRCSGSAEIEMRPTEPLKFLEVNQDTVASGVMPLGFGPAPASGIPFSSIIVEVTPEEFEGIKNRELLLPEGWETEEELPRGPSGVVHRVRPILEPVPALTDGSKSQADT